MLATKIITKRQVLSAIAKICDPLGLIGPPTIQAKILMQELWQSKAEWDDPIPNELNTIWEMYAEQIQSVNAIKIFRQIICHDPLRIEIHTFCDASEVAY
ncbi:Pao retrotransposon peptidase [Popillia japonica]|uniref:Pao retrotransposon peptidase n=1 Tax=Popillia japonica TaxID=7064 RepID=A0AAW1MBW2_POPJA